MINMYKHTELKTFKCDSCGKTFDGFYSQSLTKYKNYCSLDCEYNKSEIANKKYSLELKKLILDFSIKNEDMSTRAIAKIFGVSKDIVTNLIKRYGNRKPKKLLNFDRRYFKDINSEETAYWLGFIYADGCIMFTGEKCGKFELSLKYSDIGHLIKFNKCLKSEVEVKKKEVKLNDKIFYACRLFLGSYEFCKDLEKHGCVERKSLVLKFPKDISDDLKRHFIRGYVDGDGHLSRISKNIDGINYCTQILGTYEFLEGMIDFLYNEGIIRKNTNIIKKDKRRVNVNNFFIQLYGDNARDLIRYLYGESNIYLDRKYEIIKPLL